MGRMLLTLFDSEKNKIKAAKLTAFPICENAQIEKSIEIYDDPAPCAIKRSAVSKIIYLKFIDFLIKEVCTSDASPFPITEIPSEIITCFDFDNEVHFLDYEE